MNFYILKKLYNSKSQFEFVKNDERRCMGRLGPKQILALGEFNFELLSVHIGLLEIMNFLCTYPIHNKLLCELSKVYSRHISSKCFEIPKQPPHINYETVTISHLKMQSEIAVNIPSVLIIFCDGSGKLQGKTVAIFNLT